VCASRVYTKNVASLVQPRQGNITPLPAAIWGCGDATRITSHARVARARILTSDIGRSFSSDSRPDGSLSVKEYTTSCFSSSEALCGVRRLSPIGSLRGTKPRCLTQRHDILPHTDSAECSTHKPTLLVEIQRRIVSLVTWKQGIDIVSTITLPFSRLQPANPRRKFSIQCHPLPIYCIRAAIP
jgi:hypothetical protein